MACKTHTHTQTSTHPPKSNETPNAFQLNIVHTTLRFIILVRNFFSNPFPLTFIIKPIFRSINSPQTGSNPRQTRIQSERCVCVENLAGLACRQSGTLGEWQHSHASMSTSQYCCHRHCIQVVDIEEKLDVLIKAYMQDRERLYSLQPLPELQNVVHMPRQPPPSGGAGCGILTGGPTASGGGTLRVSVLSFAARRHAHYFLLFPIYFVCSQIAETDTD